jgi:hypothetical protein
MNSSSFEEPVPIARRLRAILLELAGHEEDLAATINAYRAEPGILRPLTSPVHWSSDLLSS